MTKIEKIQNLLEDIETDTRKSTVEDVLIELADWLTTVEPGEVAGMKRAIAIIKANF
jgi:hypothetical protein